MEQSKESNILVPSSQPVKISFKIHELIRNLQNENGLRHQDYMRYRHYLTRKLRKVRKAIGLTYGKGKSYVKKQINPDQVIHENFLLIPLLLTERAWSFASEKKDNFGKVGKKSIKRSEVVKLAKAVNWVKKLEALCESKADLHSALEASAYSSWICGQYNLEREVWDEAVLNFSKAKAIYLELSKLGSIDSQDLFTQRAEQLEPSLRFCKYNVAGSQGELVDIESLSANPELQERLRDIGLKRTSLAEGQEPIALSLGWTWSAKAVTVTVETVKASCVRVQSALEALQAKSAVAGEGVGRDSVALGASREAAYARVLSSLDDAKASVVAALHNLAAGGGGRVGEVRTELQLLKSCLQFKRLSMLHSRNSELISAIEKRARSLKTMYQELAHLHDQQLLTIREILAIPGDVI